MPEAQETQEKDIHTRWAEQAQYVVGREGDLKGLVDQMHDFDILLKDEDVEYRMVRNDEFTNAKVNIDDISQMRQQAIQDLLQALAYVEDLKSKIPMGVDNISNLVQGAIDRIRKDGASHTLGIERGENFASLGSNINDIFNDRNHRTRDFLREKFWDDDNGLREAMRTFTSIGDAISPLTCSTVELGRAYTALDEHATKMRKEELENIAPLIKEIATEAEAADGMETQGEAEIAPSVKSLKRFADKFRNFDNQDKEFVLLSLGEIIADARDEVTKYGKNLKMQEVQPQKVTPDQTQEAGSVQKRRGWLGRLFK